MKQIHHRSVIPIYAAAAFAALAALALPMYRLWHYLLYAAIAVGIYFGASRLFPGTVEEVPLPEEAPDSGDANVNSHIAEGRRLRDRMMALAPGLSGEETGQAVSRLAALADRIMAALEEEPDRFDRCRKFFTYFLPTTVSLLERLYKLEQQGLAGETQKKIRAMLPGIETAFQNQLAALYEPETMDITADIQVMQQLMEQEGLLPNENENKYTL